MNFEAMVQGLLDDARKSNGDQERVRKISELTTACAQKDELLRQGFDLMNAIMLRTGLVFKISDPELAPLIAKVKAWNLLLRQTSVINVVQGKAL